MTKGSCSAKLSALLLSSLILLECRLKAVESPAADEEVEETLENQLESLIKQCKDELGLVPKMAGEIAYHSHFE